MRVLDAGCGPGRLTIPLARRVGPSGEVVALDVQRGMLDRVNANTARVGLRNVRTLLGPLERDAAILSGETLRFDCVLLVTVLGELPDPAGALASLHSVLKPAGILSITEMLIDPDYVPANRVRALSEQAGFVVDREFGSPFLRTVNVRKT